MRGVSDLGHLTGSHSQALRKMKPQIIDLGEFVNPTAPYSKRKYIWWNTLVFS